MIDLLVIKKLQGIEIENEIGRRFRSHNVIEYKSPDDNLSIEDYLKTIGYACLYLSLENNNKKEENKIKSTDVTVTDYSGHSAHVLMCVQRMGIAV